MQSLKQHRPMLTDPAIRRFYLMLSLDEQVQFDERAGFLEYGELLPRAKAEHKAYMEILKLRRAKHYPKE